MLMHCTSAGSTARVDGDAAMSQPCGDGSAALPVRPGAADASRSEAYAWMMLETWRGQSSSSTSASCSSGVSNSFRSAASSDIIDSEWPPSCVKLLTADTTRAGTSSALANSSMMTASLSLAASRLSAPAVGHPRDSCAATEAAAAASAAEEEPPLMWLPGRTSAVALWPGDAVLKLARGVTSDDREPRMLFAPPPDLKLTLRIAVASTTASGGGSEAPSTLPATLSGRKGRHSTYVGTIHAGSVPRSIALSSSGSTSPGARYSTRCERHTVTCACCSSGASSSAAASISPNSTRWP
mmetsp:Transcript_35677/g.105431  ORF Transcript_35677/g.105431 Transcript_35677/m.105431 type:complete len:297 (-) Transcript_35677:1451-2341(-)